LLYPEKECSLPFNEYNATLRGVIDLLAVYPDHVVIHDYKTDVEKTYEDEYKVQLSIYAHAASEFYKLPAKCVIDYLSRGETMEFDPIDKSVIAQRVKEYTDL
ncbi:MAG: PD-(D/E)XK nuclease family protein, partial [Candidatus Methanomethylophilaceae archaeon]|nr:PD-(D/E)XK nuclease family protein [Candidatus Methanomethylophilaceae archaeon]